LLPIAIQHNHIQETFFTFFALLSALISVDGISSRGWYHHADNIFSDIKPLYKTPLKFKN